jgi:Dyp-type peroxidase family
MTAYADAVLPDAVSRNPTADSWLIFCDLSPGLGATQVQTWLQAATAAVTKLTTTRQNEVAVATCTSALGQPIFAKASQLGVPAHLASPPPIGTAAIEPHDALFYVFSTSDAVVAQFLRDLDATRPAGLTTISFERGYQRVDKREVFGQRDGLRNIPRDQRAAVAFVGDDQPNEPDWCRGGSYLAYLKIKQDMTAWTALAAEQQAEALGRRLDGSRLDLPPGTSSDTESVFTDGVTVPPCSHIRKAGPRGPLQDPVRIFRRGTPYVEAAGGALDQGLHFVSYQADLDAFDTMLNRWMLNSGFPTPTAGQDALFDPSRHLATIIKGGFYFAVPHDDRFLGAGMFDPPDTTSHLVITVAVTDPSGQADRTASLEGATFEITNNQAVIANGLQTDAAGRVVSGPLPTNVPLIVTEVQAPPSSALAVPPTQPVTLTCDPQRLVFTSARSGTPGQYA